MWKKEVMSEYQTEADVLAAIEEAWSAYRLGLSELSSEELEGPTDAAGWTVKDHITHVTAWEASMTAGLNRSPMHDAMGISASDLNQYVDELNERIREAHVGESVQEALEAAARGHRELILAIEALPEDALSMPAGDYMVVRNPDSARQPVRNRILRASAVHYAMHMEAIRKIVAG
jgi:hypothetical protein